MTLRLVLPLPSNRGNARSHWKATLRDKKAYWDRLNVLAMIGALPPAPPAPPAHARISAHLYLWNAMDDDNAMARCKLAIDWLKGLYIADDSRKALTWVGLPAQTIDRKNPRLEIELSAPGHPPDSTPLRPRRCR